MFFVVVMVIYFLSELIFSFLLFSKSSFASKINFDPNEGVNKVVEDRYISLTYQIPCSLVELVVEWVPTPLLQSQIFSNSSSLTWVG